MAARGGSRASRIAAVTAAVLTNTPLTDLRNEWRWFYAFHHRIGYTVSVLVPQRVSNIPMRRGRMAMEDVDVVDVGRYGVCVLNRKGDGVYWRTFKTRKAAKARAVKLYAVFESRDDAKRETKLVAIEKAKQMAARAAQLKQERLARVAAEEAAVPPELRHAEAMLKRAEMRFKRAETTREKWRLCVARVRRQVAKGFTEGRRVRDDETAE